MRYHFVLNWSPSPVEYAFSLRRGKAGTLSERSSFACMFRSVRGRQNWRRGQVVVGTSLHMVRSLSVFWTPGTLVDKQVCFDRTACRRSRALWWRSRAGRAAFSDMARFSAEG